MKMASGRAQYLSMNPCAELYLGEAEGRHREQLNFKDCREDVLQAENLTAGLQPETVQPAPRTEKKCILSASGRGEGLKKTPRFSP